MATNNSKGVIIPKELEWLVGNTSEAEETRKDFVNNFFGIGELEKKYGINLNSVTTAKEESK